MPDLCGVVRKFDFIEDHASLPAFQGRLPQGDPPSWRASVMHHLNVTLSHPITSSFFFPYLPFHVADNLS